MSKAHQIFYANDDDITQAILIDGGTEEGGMTIQIHDMNTCEIFMHGVDAHVNIDRKNIKRILWMMKSMED